MNFDPMVDRSASLDVSGFNLRAPLALAVTEQVNTPSTGKASGTRCSRRSEALSR